MYIPTFYTFQLPHIGTKHHQVVKHALSIPSRKVCEDLLAAQKELLEHANPSDVDDLTKFVLLHEKELASKVAEIGENIEKSIYCDILSHLVAKQSYLRVPLKGIVGVLITFSIIYYFKNLSLHLIFLLPLKVFSNKLLYIFLVFIHATTLSNAQE